MNFILNTKKFFFSFNNLTYLVTIQKIKPKRLKTKYNLYRKSIKKTLLIYIFLKSIFMKKLCWMVISLLFCVQIFLIFFNF